MLFARRLVGYGVGMANSVERLRWAYTRLGHLAAASSSKSTAVSIAAENCRIAAAGPVVTLNEVVDD